jgi:hypothetical protein
MRTTFVTVITQRWVIDRLLAHVLDSLAPDAPSKAVGFADPGIRVSLHRGRAAATRPSL